MRAAIAYVSYSAGNLRTHATRMCVRSLAMHRTGHAAHFGLGGATRDPRPATRRDPRPVATRDPSRPATRDPRPATRDLRPATRDPRPATRDPRATRGRQFSARAVQRPILDACHPHGDRSLGGICPQLSFDSHARRASTATPTAVLVRRACSPRLLAPSVSVVALTGSWGDGGACGALAPTHRVPSRARHSARTRCARRSCV